MKIVTAMTLRGFVFNLSSFFFNNYTLDASYNLQTEVRVALGVPLTRSFCDGKLYLWFIFFLLHVLNL